MVSRKRVVIISFAVESIVLSATVLGVVIGYLEGFSDFWLTYNIFDILLIIASYITNHILRKVELLRLKLRL